MHFSEPARTINHIQHRAEFDMDQDLHGHMIQETQVETSNWVPTVQISEGSSVYASALASKLLRAMEMEHLAVDIFS